MLDFWFFLFALGLSVVAISSAITAVYHDDRQLARCAGTVAGNWAAGTIFALSTHITDGWWFSAIIDAISAVTILYRPAGRWQAALGVSYCTQLIMHAVYGWLWLGGQADPVPYYNWLTGVAWAQLLLLGGWCGDIWRGLGDPGRNRGSVPAALARGVDLDQAR